MKKNAKTVEKEAKKQIKDMERNRFVKKGNSWRLIGPQGNVIKNFGPIDAYPLLSVLVVKQNELFGLIDLSGEMVQSCEYRNISQPFHTTSDEPHEVLELETQDERFWLADKNGKIVTSRSYKRIACGSFSHDQHVNTTWNGFADLFDSDDQNQHQKFGLFDMVNVKEILPAIYEPGVSDYCEIMGMYSLGIPVYNWDEDEMHCKLINAQGEDLIPFEKGFSSIGTPQHDDYLISAVKDGKCGYVNIHGDVKIPFRYDAVCPFENGHAIVGFWSDDGTPYDKYGVIGHHDKLLIPFVFTEEPTLYVQDGKLFAKGKTYNKGRLANCVWSEDGCVEMSDIAPYV